MESFGRKVFICLLLGLIVLTGCAKKVVPPPTAEKPKGEGIQDVSGYFPAEPKMTWEYEGTGNEYAGFTRRVMYSQGNKVQVSENNGGTVLGMVFDVAPLLVVKTYSRPEFYNDENLIEEKSNLQEVILKAPLKVGSAWKNQRDQREVVSINERVEVPAGTFNRVVKIKITSLEHKPEEGQLFEYYAEKTGLIMREFITSNDKITSKLKSFKKTESRPETKKGTIGIEGMQQEFNLNLVEGSPPAFYTYIPADMVVERVSSGEGDSFRFLANFAGKKRDDAYMTFFFYPKGTNLEQAVKFANSFILINKWQKINRQNPDTGKYYDWSESEWHFQSHVNGGDYLGSIAVGKHQDRIFHVLIYYPEDFSEGFIPRTKKILDEFVWTDTGERLEY